MDRMDIDHTVDVPDTPDRLTRQAIIGRSGVEDENHGPSMLRYSRQQNILKDSSKDQPMVIDSGSRGPSMRPNNSRRPINSISSSSAISSSLRNANLFRKGVTEKNTSYPSHDSFHNYHRRSVRPSCSSKTSFHEDSFVDLTERNVNGPVIGIASPSGVPGKNPSEFKNRSGLDNVTSSLFGRANFRTASRVLSEEMKNENGVGSSNESREAVEIVDNIQEKPSNDSPRVNKQKRLVRNGCISPNNIAKAKQLAGKDSNGSVAAAHNNNNGSKPSSAPPISIDIRELVSEDNDSYTRKGKGVMTHPCSSREPDSKNKNSLSRSSINFNDEAIAVSDYSRGAGKGIEESGGWRSTRNRTRELNISLPDDEGLHVIRSKDPTRYSGQHHENRLEISDKGVSFANGDGKGPKLIASEHTSHQTLKESVSHHRTRLGRLNGSLSTANTLIKRQKQGSTSGSGGECSTSVSGGPDVVNLEQIIEVDEYSPQLRRNAHDEDARARQLEADELLARELQEQLYNELPVFGGGEVDEQMALAWQHQDDSNYDFAQERHPVLDARVSVSNSLRQSQSRSSSSAPRRGSQSRSAALGRMTRLRSRFPGQARTLLSSRGRTSMFPEDMDVDMRMHILGALEEFSDMGLNAGILQAPRDFNENDYEMLLALDDNNDQHRGASARQINGLPQSTVQSENFEETCAICLDTPTIGDTIRHLPCLHKFHKDCIDPWLRRRTSCPVCKSSVT